MSEKEKDYTVIWDEFRQKRNDRALDVIYSDHFDWLYDYGFRCTSDCALVEDSIQNIFSYFIRKRDQLGPVTNLPFYLLKSFRRELFKQLRSQKRIELDDHIAENKFPFCFNRAEDEMEDEKNRYLLKIIRASIQKLGERQQEILFLRINRELDYAEIAEMLNISVDSCYKSVYRSIKKVKEDVLKVIPDGERALLLFLSMLKK